MLRKSLSSGVALVATMSAAAVLMVGLSGCGLTNNAVMERADATCRAQGGTPTQWADCMNRAEPRFGQQPDLLNMRMAARRELAEKVERHEMSESQALFEFAELEVALGQIQANRFQANLQTSAALLNASAALASAGAPHTLGSPVINTNCTGGGGYWNCQSH